MVKNIDSLLIVCIMYVIISLSDNINAKRVTIAVYYETHCPHCIQFFKNQLGPVIENYASRIHINLKPYGNAQTFYIDGEAFVECQHGEIECYENKLHACAIHEIRNNTKTALFNTCMISGSRYYRVINDFLMTCGRKYNISTDGIRECAVSQRGLQLLVRYGIHTDRRGVNGVPYVTLNGRPYSGNLERNLCGFLQPMPHNCFRKYGAIGGINLRR